MAHDVFISYSSYDKTIADAVCAKLESRRIRCWIAPRDVLAGTDYAESIINAIEGCQIVVLILSANSNNSPQVKREIERAVSKGVSILTFKIEDVTLTKSMEYYVSSEHWLDALTPPLENHLNKLVETIESILKPVTAPKKSEESSVFSSLPSQPQPMETGTFQNDKAFQREIPLTHESNSTKQLNLKIAIISVSVCIVALLIILLQSRIRQTVFGPSSGVISNKSAVSNQPTKKLPEESTVSKKSSTLDISMALIPGAANFPTGIDDSGSCSMVSYPYYIGKTEVTYRLWKAVYDWAVRHGYTFTNTGQPGSYTSGHADHPVTMVDWRDCIVWCNAMTEYYNAKKGTDYSCVYRYKGTVICDSKNEIACNDVESNSRSNGFRLPTSMEWELAARYIDGKRWTPGNYASGANGPYSDRTATGDVAWYMENNGNVTHPVGTKKPNVLGIYDMSGNVWEWCFDWHPKYIGFKRVSRSFLLPAFRKATLLRQKEVACGFVNSNSPLYVDNFLGFRFVRIDDKYLEVIKDTYGKMLDAELKSIENAEEEAVKDDKAPAFGLLSP